MGAQRVPECGGFLLYFQPPDQMTITFKQFRSVGINDRFYATDEDATGEHAHRYFLDATKGAINPEVDGGVAIPPDAPAGFTSLADPATSWVHSVSSAALVGPTRSPSAGKEVVVQATANGSGFLVIEDTPDGTTWTVQGLAPVRPGVTLGIRFTPSSAWRVKYFDDTRQGTKHVQVWSQIRDLGV